MNKLKTLLFLTAILTIGLALRLYHNTDISLWHDEAFSVLLLKYSWGEMMQRIALDVHPPMYYIALRIWHYVFGDSLLALRGFSIFFGLATALGGYALVKAAFKNNKAALLTSLLIAVNPFQIQYATEARMYTFGAFFLLLAAFALIKALDRQKSENKNDNAVIAYYLLFAMSVSVIILTHYYLLFTAAALCTYALLYHLYYYRGNIRRYWLLFAAYCFIALSFLPWLKTFLFQYKQVGAGYWIPPMDVWSIPSTLWQMAVGIGVDTGKSSTQVLLALLTLVAVYIISNFLRKTESPHKWLAVLVFVAPFGGAILFLILAKLKGQSSSVYLVRYFLYASAFFSIIIATWISQLKFKKLAYGFAALYVLLGIAGFINYWNGLDIETKPGMNRAVEFLQTNVTHSDKLYVGSSFEFFNLKYYLSQRAPGFWNSSKPWVRVPSINGKCEIDCLYFESVPRPLLYSGGQRTIENMPHFAGTAILTNHDLIPDFTENTKRGDTVWLLWTNGFGGSKPETPPNWQKIDEHGFAEVRPYVGTWVIITQYKVE